MKKATAFLLSILLIFQQPGFAQIALPANLSGLAANSPVSELFRPIHFRYLSYDNSGGVTLLLDKGDSAGLPDELQAPAKKLLEYFLTGLTLPDAAFWVNLRPDAPQKVIDGDLARTDMGRVMLEADLQLKKDCAKYTSPRLREGKEYWEKLYRKAEELYGTAQVTIPALTRPWIVPDEIIVREAGNSAYIYKATLKVLLEGDYLKDSAAYKFSDARQKQLNEYSSRLIRENIIPRLNKEINGSRRYASLRQVYYSLILSRWFKGHHTQAPQAYTRRIDSRDLTDLTSKTAWSASSYFEQYRASFASGEYNIRETVQASSGATVRTYFAGGIPWTENLSRTVEAGMIHSEADAIPAAGTKYNTVTVPPTGAINIAPVIGLDEAGVRRMLGPELLARLTERHFKDTVFSGNAYYWLAKHPVPANPVLNIRVDTRRNADGAGGFYHSALINFSLDEEACLTVKLLLFPAADGKPPAAELSEIILPVAGTRGTGLGTEIALRVFEFLKTSGYGRIAIRPEGGAGEAYWAGFGISGYTEENIDNLIGRFRRRVHVHRSLIELLNGDNTTAISISAVENKNGVETIEFAASNNANIASGSVTVDADEITVYDKNGEYVGFRLAQAQATPAEYLQAAQKHVRAARDTADVRLKKEAVAKAVDAFKYTELLSGGAERIIAGLKTMRSGSPEERLVAALGLLDENDFRVSEEERLECLAVIKERQEWVVKYTDLAGYVDMHCHTFRSDGTHSPSRIVFSAWRRGLTALGVVDHNTVQHVYEAERAADILGMDVTTGTEFSVHDRSLGLHNFHLLVYFNRGPQESAEVFARRIATAEEAAGLAAGYKEFVAKKWKRLEALIGQFNREHVKEGLTLSLDDLGQLRTMYPTRYHLSKALLQKDTRRQLHTYDFRVVSQEYFPTNDDAGEDDYNGMEIGSVLAFARTTNAFAVLAHPGEITNGARRISPAQAEALFGRYKGRIDGIEALSSKHNPSEFEEFTELARRFDLAITSGTDNHDSLDSVQMGRGYVKDNTAGNIPLGKMQQVWKGNGGSSAQARRDVSLNDGGDLERLARRFYDMSEEEFKQPMEFSGTGVSKDGALFHGTSEDFVAFDLRAAEQSSRKGIETTLGRGFYFTTPDKAREYANLRATAGERSRVVAARIIKGGLLDCRAGVPRWVADDLKVMLDAVIRAPSEGWHADAMKERYSAMLQYIENRQKEGRPVFLRTKEWDFGDLTGFEKIFTGRGYAGIFDIEGGERGMGSHVSAVVFDAANLVTWEQVLAQKQTAGSVLADGGRKGKEKDKPKGISLKPHEAEKVWDRLVTDLLKQEKEEQRPAEKPVFDDNLLQTASRTALNAETLYEEWLAGVKTLDTFLGMAEFRDRALQGLDALIRQPLKETRRHALVGQFWDKGTQTVSGRLAGLSAEALANLRAWKQAEDEEIERMVREFEQSQAAGPDQKADGGEIGASAENKLQELIVQARSTAGLSEGKKENFRRTFGKLRETAADIASGFQKTMRDSFSIDTGKVRVYLIGGHARRASDGRPRAEAISESSDVDLVIAVEKRFDVGKLPDRGLRAAVADVLFDAVEGLAYDANGRKTLPVRLGQRYTRASQRALARDMNDYYDGRTDTYRNSVWIDLQVVGAPFDSDTVRAIEADSRTGFLLAQSADGGGVEEILGDLVGAEHLREALPFNSFDITAGSAGKNKFLRFSGKTGKRRSLTMVADWQYTDIYSSDAGLMRQLEERLKAQGALYVADSPRTTVVTADYPGYFGPRPSRPAELVYPDDMEAMGMQALRVFPESTAELFRFSVAPLKVRGQELSYVSEGEYALNAAGSRNPLLVTEGLITCRGLVVYDAAQGGTDGAIAHVIDPTVELAYVREMIGKLAARGVKVFGFRATANTDVQTKAKIEEYIRANGKLAETGPDLPSGAFAFSPATRKAIELFTAPSFWEDIGRTIDDNAQKLSLVYPRGFSYRRDRGHLAPMDVTPGAGQNRGAGKPLADGRSAQAPRVASLSDGGSAQARDQDKKGGIDFRRLPAVTQKAAQSLLLDGPALAGGMDIEKEWKRIHGMVQGGISPSCDRIGEFVRCCYGAGELARYAPGIVSCVADILRMEEQKAQATEPMLRDILLLLDTTKLEDTGSENS